VECNVAEALQPFVRNLLLARLDSDDFGYIAPHLRPVELKLHTTLHRAGEPILAVLFPEHGYASMLITIENGNTAGVGMIGYEGVIGVPVILGTDRSMTDVTIQRGGHAMQLPVDVFRRALSERAGFQALMLRFAMALTAQVTLIAACNCRHMVKQRLSGWLLMAHDRTDGDEFTMTHELLSMMLGVRRVGVTLAAGALQRAGYINYYKGRVRVVDRNGLETAACECHATARREFQRLVGPIA
jgi:CRP-like cAMP-binding protein